MCIVVVVVLNSNPIKILAPDKVKEKGVQNRWKLLLQTFLIIAIN